MRYRRSKNYKERIEKYYGNIIVEKFTDTKGKWEEIFGNQNPIHIEIGMGKGQFIRTMAINNPNINYIGIEKLEPLLLLNSEKIERENIKNTKLMSINANFLQEYFSDDEISGLYLNFSDPWPKKRDANKRLTHINMMKKYLNILKENSIIQVKTDNDNLFEFTLEEAESLKLNILEKYWDWSKEKEYINGNVKTEYETKFLEDGKPIHMVKFSSKKLENIVK